MLDAASLSLISRSRRRKATRDAWGHSRGNVSYWSRSCVGQSCVIIWLKCNIYREEKEEEKKKMKKMMKKMMKKKMKKKKKTKKMHIHDGMYIHTFLDYVHYILLPSVHEVQYVLYTCTLSTSTSTWTEWSLPGPPAKFHPFRPPPPAGAFLPPPLP